MIKSEKQKLEKATKLGKEVRNLISMTESTNDPVTNDHLLKAQRLFANGVAILIDIKESMSQLYDASETIETVAKDCIKICGVFTSDFSDNLMAIVIGQSGFTREAIIAEMVRLDERNERVENGN